jgi:hypothetical protein
LIDSYFVALHFTNFLIVVVCDLCNSHRTFLLLFDFGLTDLFNRIFLLEAGFDFLAILLLNFIVGAFVLRVCLNDLLLLTFKGLLHAAGDAITLPLRTPEVHLYLRTLDLPLLLHT